MKQIYLTIALALVALCTSAQVTVTEDEITPSSVTLSFAPGNDVASYYVCLFDEGSLESQFAMWSMFMGFQDYGDMIMAWGFKNEGTTTKTWDNLAPATTYDIWIQSLDADGTKMEPQCYKVTTAAQGGEEASVINITIGEYGEEEDVNGVLQSYQWVKFEPNDQTAHFFDFIITDAGYNEAGGAEGVKQILKDSEGQPQYTFYSTDNDRWNVVKGTTYHAVAIGVNAKGEWGEMAEVVFVAGEGTQSAVKDIVLGQKNNGPIYDIMGRKVTNLESGKIYIQNGHKFVK